MSILNLFTLFRSAVLFYMYSGRPLIHAFLQPRGRYYYFQVIVTLLTSLKCTWCLFLNISIPFKVHFGFKYIILPSRSKAWRTIKCWTKLSPPPWNRQRPKHKMYQRNLWGVEKRQWGSLASPTLQGYAYMTPATPYTNLTELTMKSLTLSRSFTCSMSSYCVQLKKILTYEGHIFGQVLHVAFCLLGVFFPIL